MRPSPSLHDLIPLELAARAVQQRAYKDRVTLGSPIDTLNGLAQAIAALVPIFAFGISGTDFRRLSAEDLLGGHFRGGARELHFLDGRPAIAGLAVTTDSVDTVARSLLMTK